MTDMKKFTYGVELELTDTDMTKPIPEGWYITGDPDILNSNGAAADPLLKDYKFGAEFNSKPTNSIEEMMARVKVLLNAFPEAKVNHRSVMHCHIAWEGIEEDFQSLQKILKYTYEGNGQYVINKYWHYPITPEMDRNTKSFRTFDCKVMPKFRYEHCMAATNVKEFREGHAVVSDGRILWQTTKRFAVNLYSVYTSGSIEFRHFFPTVDVKEIEDAFKFITTYVNEALKENGRSVPQFMEEEKYNLPKEYPYNHELEKSWLKTNFKFNTREVANWNREVLLGKLNEDIS